MEELDDLGPRSFRRRRPLVRVLLWAAATNLLLLGAGLIGPHLRGRARAAQATERFADFAACLWGGRPAADPGLGLPPGERTHYAAQALAAQEAWPERCRAPLGQIAPEEAWLLFPEAKGAEATVREAVARVDRELQVAGERRRAGRMGRVPERPLLATGRLLAALALWKRATGDRVDVDAHAIVLDGAPALAEPTRVPLALGPTARVTMRPWGDGIAVHAFDRRGVAWVRVGGGRTDLRRVRRPPLLRGVFDGPGGPWGIFATSKERCALLEGGCAGRASGVAPLFAEAQAEADPAPLWLAAHPGGEPAASVVADGDAVHLIALAGGAGHALEARRFSGIEGWAATAAAPGSRGPPQRADRSVLLEGTSSARAFALLPGHPPAVVYAAAPPAGAAGEAPALFLLLLSDDAAPERLSRTQPAVSALDACAAPGATFVLARSERGAATLARVPASGPRWGIAGPAAPAAARVALACDDERVDVAWITAARDLRLSRCGPRPGCAQPTTLAEDVSALDAVREDEVTWIAYAGDAGGATVRVVRVGEGGPEAPRVVAACWDPDAGFCGPPSLSASNGRVLLSAREREDLLVVETTDAGARWGGMRGVR